MAGSEYLHLHPESDGNGSGQVQFNTSIQICDCDRLTFSCYYWILLDLKLTYLNKIYNLCRYRSVAVTRLPSTSTNNHKILSTAGVIITINITATLAILPYSAHIHWEVRHTNVQISFANKNGQGHGV